MIGSAPDPVESVTLFARLLRDAGLTTGPERVRDACQALLAINLEHPDEVRYALRAVFVTRREEGPVFDAAFDLFFSSPGGEGRAGSIPGRTRPLALDPKQALAWMNALGLSSPGVAREVEGPPASSTGYSAEELLRQRDFREMSWDELAAVRRLLRQSPWKVAERRTRRLRADRRGSVELRRTLRAAARQGGDAPRLARASVSTKRRPLVILCDVSGSMDRYSRHLLVFAHVIGRRERVETFAFSTHLTRITHLLRHGDIDSALDHVAAQVHDIGGGTRIADALHTFQRDHARRVLGHGAVVLIISDGWDRGDPEQLGREMARLRRSCHRLIWLNPLLGSTAYQPETRGMAAALPHCDDFLSAHSVDALDALGRLLGQLPRRVNRSPGGAVAASGAPGAAAKG
ncbi:MAG: VWA domain-containing protein [Candidatus Dormiibacterota bacterium]